MSRGRGAWLLLLLTAIAVVTAHAQAQPSVVQVDVGRYAATGIVRLYVDTAAVDADRISPADVRVAEVLTVHDTGLRESRPVEVLTVQPRTGSASWFFVIGPDAGHADLRELTAFVHGLRPPHSRVGVSTIDGEYRLVLPLSSGRGRIHDTVEELALPARDGTASAAESLGRDATRGSGRHYLVAVGADARPLEHDHGYTVVPSLAVAGEVLRRGSDYELTVDVRLTPGGKPRRTLMVELLDPTELALDPVPVAVDAGPLLSEFAGSEPDLHAVGVAALLSLLLWILVPILARRTARRRKVAAPDV